MNTHYNKSTKQLPRTSREGQDFSPATPNPQSGVTLLISLVVLSAVTFISFSLSAIILREIAAAQLVIRTEPAISGASTGVEIGLMRLFRNHLDGVETTGSVSQSTQVNYQIDTNFYINNLQYSLSAEENPTTLIALYNVENPGTSPGGYSWVRVSSDSGNAPVSMRVISWTNPDIALCTYTITYGSPRECSLNSSVVGYVVELSVTYGSANVLVSTSSPGIPSPDQSFTATGVNEGIRRVIEVNLRSP